MREDIKNLLFLGAVLGIGFFLYTKLTHQQKILSIQLTRRIAQEIKHQMLIVSITFAESTRQGISKLKKQEVQQLIDFYTSKMAEIFQSKQKLILQKYQSRKDNYQLSLQKYKNDKKLKETKEQIIEMMRKSVRGQMPNIAVDKKVQYNINKIINSIGKEQAKKIIQDVDKMILIRILLKVQQEKRKNQHLDFANDQRLKITIRDINIYQTKRDFFAQRGFKQQWGEPNQNFLKLTEGYKLEDPKFKQQLKQIQNTFDLVLNKITVSPLDITPQMIISQFDNMGRDQRKAQKMLSKSALESNSSYLKEGEVELFINKSTRSQPKPNEQLQKHESNPDEFFSIQGSQIRQN